MCLGRPVIAVTVEGRGAGITAIVAVSGLSVVRFATSVAFSTALLAAAISRASVVLMYVVRQSTRPRTNEAAPLDNLRTARVVFMIAVVDARTLGIGLCGRVEMCM